MNYRVNEQECTIQTTEEAVDNEEVFGYFQTAKAQLIAVIAGHIAELRKEISRVRKLKESNLVQHVDGE